MNTNGKGYREDFVLSASLVVLSIFVILESLKLRPSPYEPLGPAFVPRALGALLIVLSVPVAWQGYQKWRASARSPRVASEVAETQPAAAAADGPAVTGTKRPMLSWLTGITAILYIAAIRPIGFRISTTVVILFLGAALYYRERRGQPITFFSLLVVIAVGMSQLLYFIFTRILVVNLP